MGIDEDQKQNRSLDRGLDDTCVRMKGSGNEPIQLDINFIICYERLDQILYSFCDTVALVFV